MPGVTYTIDEKILIARQLDELGVPKIEAGFPITSHGETEAVKRIAALGLDAQVVALARPLKEDIDRALKCDVPYVHVFISTSDLHIETMMKTTREEVMRQTVEGVEYAKEHGVFVEYSPQDATRGSYGNGAAMRVAAIGVCYYDDVVMLREIAEKSGQITHAHRLGKEGAVLQAYAVALAANLSSQETFRQSDFLAELTGFTQEAIYQEKFGLIGELLERSDNNEVIIKLGNGIEAFNSVPTAIFSFLSQPHSFAQAVLQAVGLGGDADTIGAMTGAISGAYLGIASIPVRWRDKLENRRYIEELGERLFTSANG